MSKEAWEHSWMALQRTGPRGLSLLTELSFAVSQEGAGGGGGGLPGPGQGPGHQEMGRGVGLLVNGK